MPVNIFLLKPGEGLAFAGSATGFSLFHYNLFNLPPQNFYSMNP